MPASADVNKLPQLNTLIRNIEASPTPYHAVKQSLTILSESGFTPVAESSGFPSEPGNYFLQQGGSFIAWRQYERHEGFVIAGAHSDSPNLRVRHNPDVASAGLAQVGMETYGGVLLNSWLDRDLGLAGRVQVATPSGLEEQLLLDSRPLLRIPQLAIHLDRRVRKDGLKLSAQKHMIPIWASEGTDDADSSGVRGYVADHLSVEPTQVLSWDLMAFDVQPPTLAGRKNEFFVSARIDNLYSVFAGVQAMSTLDVASSARTGLTSVLAVFDHEEVGSRSSTGAESALLSRTLERIAAAKGHSRSDFLGSMSNSLMLSVDGAHATHPNYVDKHDPNHHIHLNEGVVIKRNANQRYATDAISEARIAHLCQEHKIPLQFYVHHNDLPCGSTIGPAVATSLGISTVDLGAPQLAMHSIRETAGSSDFLHLCDLIRSSWGLNP